MTNKNLNFKIIGITLLGVLLVVLMGVFLINGVQNRAIGLEEQVKTASSDIKIQEKRRVDLVYNLVDIVKEYDKHEYNTLKDVVDARKGSDVQLSEVKTMLTATAESYPQLKSNENYKDLMNELSVTENLIAEHRSNYNKQIKNYNRYIKKFPNKQCLSILGYDGEEFEYLDYKAPVDAPQNLFDK